MKKTVIYVLLLCTVFQPVNLYACDGETCYGSGVSSTTGHGDQPCGVCSDIVTNYLIGFCVITSNPEETCPIYTYYAKHTEKYDCNQPGTLGVLLCISTALLCGKIVGEISLLCGEACLVSPLACTACVLALIAGEVGCTCAFMECLCPCDYIGSEDSNPIEGCW